MAGPRFITPLYEHALALGNETDHVRQVIRRRRLIPSDPATAPDLWPWSLRVSTLGRFEILRDDEPIRSSRKAQHKPLELLKVLCAFGGSRCQVRCRIFSFDFVSIPAFSDGWICPG